MKFSKAIILIHLALFAAAGCGVSSSPTTAPTNQVTHFPETAGVPSTAITTKEALPSEQLSPTPPSATPTHALPTVDNIYIGKDSVRQPVALVEPMVEIIDLTSLESYPGSYAEIFLQGTSVNEHPILGGEAMLKNLILLLNAAREAGFLGQTVYSSYRSFEDQKFLIGRGKSDYTQETDQFLAEPGRSEHQLGTVVDLGWGASLLDPYVTYNNPAAGEFYQWLKAHAHEYGFVISYPFKSNAEGTMSNLFEPWITEYKAETWHIRFVGVMMASMIFTHLDEQGRNYLDPYSNITPQQFYLP